MAAHKLPIDAARDAVERVESKLREGYRPKGMAGTGPGAIMAAAEQAIREGVCDTAEAFKSRVLAGRLHYQLEPDWGLYRPARYQQPLPKLVLYPAAPPDPVVISPTREGTRVLAIGDLHNDPRHPHRIDVLTWIARYASEQKFERIVQVGDWATWDSCSHHDKNDTLKGRLKPSIKDDMDNLVASHQAFRRGMAEGYRPKLDFLQGNHEYRVERFENANPEAYGTFTTQRDETFLQFGWRSRPYGELHYVEQVAFTHHPTNAAGRAYGGKTGPQRGANDSTVAMVSGHTHKKQLHDAPKNGPLDVLSMVEIGCAMPWGEIEHYVGHSPSGWWWGVVPMTCCDGLIPDLDFFSMRRLRSIYSDDGSDVRAAA